MRTHRERDTVRHIFSLAHPIQVELLIAKLPSFVTAEVQSTCDSLEEKCDSLLERLRDVVDGSRKKKVTDWWLTYIGDKTLQFLEIRGFVTDALPFDYLDKPPNDIQVVLSNVSLLKRILSGDLQSELIGFVDRVTSEVYSELNHFRSELEIAIEYEWASLGINIFISKNQRTMMRCDLQYLQEMKEMDEEIKRERTEGREERKGKKLEMTHVVPVGGLILAKFHIYLCEHETALVQWKHLASSLLSSSLLSFQGDRGNANTHSRWREDPAADGKKKESDAERRGDNSHDIFDELSSLPVNPLPLSSPLVSVSDSLIQPHYMKHSYSPSLSSSFSSTIRNGIRNSTFSYRGGKRAEKEIDPNLDEICDEASRDLKQCCVCHSSVSDGDGGRRCQYCQKIFCDGCAQLTCGGVCVNGLRHIFDRKSQLG